MKADKLIDQVLQNMQGLDPDQMTEFVRMMTTLLLSIMRGINDEEFVRDYLTAAINDKNPPVITPHLRH